MSIVGSPAVCPNGGGDCDDEVATINPGATEICDDLDNNCADGIDEGCDDDNDDYCDANMTVVGAPIICPNGGGDCDDEVAVVNPGTTEICDDIDNNCSDGVDEGCDNDSDDYCDSSMTVIGTPGICPNGGGDCDDEVATINPGATEVCDDIDNNCNDGVDEGCDDDSDDYCDASMSMVGSPATCPNGGDDCNDNDDTIYPDALEICDGIGIIVPAYFYPAWWDSSVNLWDDLAIAASQIPIIAIMNPDSGSGASQNSDYVQEVDNLRNAGGKVIGYVATNYGDKDKDGDVDNDDLDDCKAEVDNYYNWYNVDGIFFDEMSNLPGKVDFYKNLYAYVVSKRGIVVGNPGTVTDPGYMEAATILNIFENTDDEYPGHTPDEWIKNYSPSSFSNTIHEVSDEFTMKNYIDLARSRNIGWIYITDDICEKQEDGSCAKNPWDTLPSYWEHFIDLSNGEDNNCDGEINEGFNFGELCTVGEGICQATGFNMCSADGMSTDCGATEERIPNNEICDGLDNDCDGYTDEGGETLCDDGLYCNGAETCDGVSGCQPGTSPDCDDGIFCNGTESCNEDADQCVSSGDPCPDDGIFCNGTESCDEAGNQCISSGDPCPDDGVVCTEDSCDEVGDQCLYAPNDTLCDDGAWCNGAETCDLLKDCQSGAAPDCDDGVSCTVDICNEGADSCDNTPNDSLCNNGLWCDGTETCDSVKGCQPGTPIACSDGIDCTDDSCDDVSDKCAYLPNNAKCDDGAWCNGAETCDPVNDCKAGTAPECSDGVSCTVDTCNETTDSCDNTPNDANCDDGTWCNGLETCDSVNDCQAGTTPNCNDQNPCTEDICNEDTDGCVNDPVTCEELALTPTGNDVEITLLNCSMIFENVTTEGETTIRAMIPPDYEGPPSPGTFRIADRYYDLSTTADYNGIIEICFNYEGLTGEDHLLHYNTDHWKDVTTLYDEENNMICGEVTIFSEFIIAFPTITNYDVDEDNFGVEDHDCNDNDPNINPNAVEICDDGIDNDCDGKTDHEDIEDCGCTEEICDGIDNNCDGETDEGCDDDGDGYCDANMAVVELPPAICSHGVDDCDDHDDEIYPSNPDICDGKNNDCDDNTKDGSAETPPLNSKQNGVCESSIRSCNGSGGWVDDYNDIPSYEQGGEISCDTLDNDCDGESDEDFPGLGEPCEECLSSGTVVCSDDGKGTVCDAVPGTPGTEMCDDNIDNDCDGETDEEECNHHPDCLNVTTSIDDKTSEKIWPPNHKMVDIEILAVTDPDGDPVIITITGISQDEPVNGIGDSNTFPDGDGVDTDIAQVRAERSGAEKNGRVYEISFVADDGRDGRCNGYVQVCVPHDKKDECTDDGQVYDSTDWFDFDVTIDLHEDPIEICFTPDRFLNADPIVTLETGKGTIVPDSGSAVSPVNDPCSNNSTYCVFYTPSEDDSEVEIWIEEDSNNPVIPGFIGSEIANFVIDPFQERATSFCIYNVTGGSGVLQGVQCGVNGDSVIFETDENNLDLSGAKDENGNPLQMTDFDCVPIKIVVVDPNSIPAAPNNPITSLYDISLSNGVVISNGQNVTIKFSFELTDGSRQDFDTNKKVFEVYYYDETTDSWLSNGVDITNIQWDSDSTGTIIFTTTHLTKFAATAKSITGGGDNSDSGGTQAASGGGGCSVNPSTLNTSMFSALTNSLLFLLPIIILEVRRKRETRKPKKK